MDTYFKQIPFKIECDNIGDLQFIVPTLYSAMLNEVNEHFIFLWHTYPIKEKDAFLTVTKFYQIKTKTP